MLRPKSESLCIYEQRTNMYLNIYMNYKEAWNLKKKQTIIWCKETIVNLISPSSQETNLWKKYIVLFGSFSNMQRWKVPSTLLSTSLKRISSSLFGGLCFNLGHPYAFGNRWFLRIILTVALVEAISMLHQTE